MKNSYPKLNTLVEEPGAPAECTRIENKDLIISSKDAEVLALTEGGTEIVADVASLVLKDDLEIVEITKKTILKRPKGTTAARRKRERGMATKGRMMGSRTPFIRCRKSFAR